MAWGPQNRALISHPQLCLRGDGGEGTSGGVAPRGRLRSLPCGLWTSRYAGDSSRPTGLVTYTSSLTVSSGLDVACPWGFLRVLFRHDSGPPCYFPYSDSAPMTPGTAARPSPIISFRVLHLISDCWGRGWCGFAGRVRPHRVTSWILSQWQDSPVRFPRLLWLQNVLSKASKLDSETRNVGAAAVSGPEDCWQWTGPSVVPAIPLWGLGPAWDFLAWWV